MIGYLKGQVLECSDGKLLVGVGDPKSFGTVGYAVSVPQGVAYSSVGEESEIELFIYTHVREDVLELFGFISKFEKMLFLTLLSVNGIGPKSALGILSSVEPQQLLEAISQGDQAFLTQIPGIGKKTAERVVVELRDTLRKKLEQGAFGALSKAAPVASISGLSKDLSRDFHWDYALLKDAQLALVSLGYREQDIQGLLKKVMSDPLNRPNRVEDVVKTALRQLI